jgi:hypothetical protein
MNYVENNKQYDALKRWLAAENFTVFGTLKFPSKYPISEYKSQRLVCNFFKKLDRAYYGSAAENIGMRHNRVVFKHMGTSGANLHYHFLAKPHTDPALFAELARKQWANMGTWTMDYVDTDIKAVRSNEGASNYMLHEYYKL